MNTKIISAIALSAALAAPAFAFAQSADTPVTRASVRSELISLERAGYNPGTNDIDYPQNLQAAEHRLQVQNATSFGGAAAGSNASGQAAH